MDEEKKEEKKIEIINGDGTNLDISPVYDHISTENPVNEITFDKIRKEFINILCEYLDESGLKYSIVDKYERYTITIRL